MCKYNFYVLDKQMGYCSRGKTTQLSFPDYYKNFYLSKYNDIFKMANLRANFSSVSCYQNHSEP